MKHKIHLIIAAVCLVLTVGLVWNRLNSVPDVAVDESPVTTAAAVTAPVPAVPAARPEAEPMPLGYQLTFTEQPFAYAPLPLAEAGWDAGLYRSEAVDGEAIQHFVRVEGSEHLSALYLGIAGAVYLLDGESMQPGDRALLTRAILPAGEPVYTCRLGKGADYVTNLYIVIRQGVPLFVCRIDGPRPLFYDLDGDGVRDIVSTQSSVPFTTLYLVEPDKGFRYAVLNHLEGVTWAQQRIHEESDDFLLGGSDGRCALYHFNPVQLTLYKEADSPEGPDGVSRIEVPYLRHGEARLLAGQELLRQQWAIEARWPGTVLMTCHEGNPLEDDDQTFCFIFSAWDDLSRLLLVEIAPGGDVVESRLFEPVLSEAEALEKTFEHLLQLRGEYADTWPLPEELCRDWGFGPFYHADLSEGRAVYVPALRFGFGPVDGLTEHWDIYVHVETGGIVGAVMRSD